MDGERNEFDQVGFGDDSWIRSRQGPAFLKKTLSQIFHRAGDHEPGVGQIEALRNGAREIEGLRNDHFAGGARKMEGYMVAEHTSILLHRANRGQQKRAWSDRPYSQRSRQTIGFCRLPTPGRSSRQTGLRKAGGTACPTDTPIFHEVLLAEGPSQPTTETYGLSHPYNRISGS